MTTPADWYPDPEVRGQLRYWDGSSWTEHRAPAQPPTSTEPAPADPGAGPEDSSPTDGGVHAEPDAEPDAEPAAQKDEAPAFTPPPLPAWDPPPGGPTYPPPSGASWDTPPVEQSQPPASAPSWGAPPSGQSYEPAAYAPPPFNPGPQGPPTGSPEGPNKKLVIGILSGAAALILILALALVYVFVIRDDSTAVVASPSKTSSTSSSTSTTDSETSETSESAAPDPSNSGPVTDGNLTFSITGVEAAATVTSTFSDEVGKTAQGTYAVVSLKVTNIGTEPTTFLATFQRLNGSGQSLAPDDEATIFAGGGYADVAPGAEVDTVVVFDVPDEVEPTSMFFQESPVTPGVELTF